MYKKNNEKAYNIKIQLKEINNIFPIKGNIIITIREWKKISSEKKFIKFKNTNIDNINDFKNLFYKYKNMENIIILNIKILLVEEDLVENL